VPKKKGDAAMGTFRVLMALACGFAAAVSAEGGWYALNHEFNTIDNIRYLNGHDVFMTSSAKNLLRSRDGGSTWQIVMYPFTKMMYLTDYHCFSADTILIGGYGAGIRVFLTCDGGEHWTPAVDSSLADASTGLFFHFYDRTFGWIANGSEVILRTTDGAAGWTTLPTPVFSKVNDLCFVDMMEGYAGTNLGLYRTTNGGISWSAAGGDCAGTSIKKVRFLTATRAWGISGHKVFQSVNGGASWKVDPAFDTTKTYSALCVLDGKNTWVGGGGGTLFATGTENAVWNDLCGKISSDVLDLAFATPQEGLLGGNVLYRTRDGGVSWTKETRSITRRLSAVCYTDSLTGFIGANDGYSRSYIMRTTDGGATWEETDLGGNSVNIEDVEFVDRTHGWCLSRPGKIFSTQDGGSTWSMTQLKNAGNIFGVSFFDRNHGCVGGWYGRIYRTADGGRTWDTVQTNTDEMLEDVACLSDHAMAASYWPGKITISTDSGKTWRMTGSLPSSSRTSICFFDTLHGWLASGNWIARTVDGGETWTNTVWGTEKIQSISFINKDTGWICGDNAMLAKTVDGGVTWKQEIPQVYGSFALNALFAMDQHHVWAVGDNGEIFQTSPPPSPAFPVIQDTTGCQPFTDRGQNRITERNAVLQRCVPGLGRTPSVTTGGVYNLLGRKIPAASRTRMSGSIVIQKASDTGRRSQATE
jgi:photosystem II stability/assembly factor-like uncharacterized protein